MTTELSIVILHHGSPKEVSRNLEALQQAWLPKKTEVLVINNGTRGANALIQVSPHLKFDLRFFEIENKGYPQGNNFGLSIAQGKYLCILNPDVAVQKQTFQVLLDYLKAHPKLGMVGPRLRYPSGKVQDNYRVFPRALDLLVKRTFLRRIFLKRMRRYLMWDKTPEVSEPVDWLTGAFQLFTRKCWEAVGPSDERYFLFMSDVELCRLAWEKGFQVHFVGETEAAHSEGRISSGGVLSLFTKKTLRIHVKDALKYYLKWMFRRLPPSRRTL
ncbi:glycosyltransferase [Candidatus Peregrinibacteria bacterium]|nr:MAG: glycosyltransferase [Candidatus Peregrinibacteria bacterium]